MRRRVGRFVRFGRWAIAPIWAAGLALLWWTATPMPSHLMSNLLATYLLAWGGAALAARRGASGLRARFALMTGALALVLAGLELPAALGVVDYAALFPPPLADPIAVGLDRPDPELLHVHRPYLRASGSTQGDLVVLTFTPVPSAPRYRFDARYDRHGFRNPADLDRADVAVVGDSFVEGVLVADDDLMTTALGRALGCTAANLGQSKYGPQQELAVLRRFAVPLRPRVCVWAFFEGNDLLEIPLYDRIVARRGLPPDRRGLADRSFTRNALTAAIRVLGLDRSLYAEFLRRSGVVRLPGGEEARLFFRYPGRPPTAADRAALEEFATILGAARDLCEQNRIKLVVVFVPTKYRVYEGTCRFEPGSPCLDWVRDDLPEVLRSLVARVSPSIGYLDLTSPFRDRASAGPLLYFADDTHWSPEGHRLAGRLLADYLGREGLIPR